MAEALADPNHECAALMAAVSTAAKHSRPLYIHGGNSKRALIGRDCQGSALDLSDHRGIVDYQPGELVVTARAGTTLQELGAVLAGESQVLPFDPPLFGGRATLGGTLASNLSGPARPWCGSIRDLVLGVQLINGRGELLNFGGQVMKNVAGYDVSRLQAGALGTLGVITRVSMKVLPRPEHSLTLAYESTARDGLAMMKRCSAEAAPLSGACWWRGQLYLRLSGATAAVKAAARRWGGESLDDQASPWAGLRELQHPCFEGDSPLWRFSVDSSSSILLEEDVMIDWGGAQRWLRGPHDASRLHALASEAGGHVILFRGGDRNAELRAAPGATEQRLHRRLKHSFDPAGIFNPGRMYSWL